MASRIFGVDIDLQSNQAKNMVLHSITGSGDFHSLVGGAIGYMSTAGDKRIAFWDDQLSALIKVPRLDRAEAVTSQWSFSPGSVQAPFALGANALGQLVTGLNADKLDGFDGSQALNVSTVAVRDASGRIKAADPSASDDVASKGYVDAVAAGLNTRQSCRVATAAALPANTRTSNTITASANGSINGTGIDAITTLAVNDRVLVKNEATQANNGIYSITALGDGSNPWTMVRATDADETAELHKAYVAITEGTANGGSGWNQTTANPTINTSAIVWQLFNPPVSITAGNGIVKVGSAIHVGQSASYTQGGLFFASAGTTIGHTAALTGIVQGNGASAPAAINGTANYIPKWSASAPYLSATSKLYDDGTSVIVGNTSALSVRDGAGGTITPGLQVFQSGISAISAAVSDGTNNRRVALGINQTSGVGFISTNQAAGAFDLVFDIGGAERCRITSAGILQAPGPFNINTVTGGIEIKSGGGNGNIVLTPNGTGYVLGGNLTGTAFTTSISDGAFFGGESAGINTGIGAVGKQTAFNTYVTALELHNHGQTNTRLAGIALYTGSDSAQKGRLYFLTHDGTSYLARWGIIETGVLEAQGAQTIRTNTGNLSLLTAGGNGNVLITPHGTGTTIVTNTSSNYALSAVRTGVNGAGYTGILTVDSDAKTIGDAVLISFRGQDSGSGTQEYARVLVEILDPTSGGEDAKMVFQTVGASSMVSRWQIQYNGVLEAIGAQTIQTSTGNLTLATSAANGHILLQPNGTGYVFGGNFATVPNNSAITEGGYFGTGSAATVGGLGLAGSTTSFGTTISVLEFHNMSQATQRNALIACVTGSASAQAGQLYFYTHNGTAIADRWRMLESGVWESNGSQTIQTSSGLLTLQASGGNVAIGTVTPASKLGLKEAAGSSAAIHNYDTDDTLLNIVGASRAVNDLLTGSANTDLVLNQAYATGSIRFGTGNTLRWSMSNTGVLEAAAAQTIQSATGHLTLATAAGNGQVKVTPNGTGFLTVQKATTNTRYTEIGNLVESLTAATSNTQHKCSPYSMHYANIWNGSASAAKGIGFQAQGISGSDLQYGMEIASSDIANIMFIRGDIARVGIGNNAPTQSLDVTGQVRIRSTSSLNALALRFDGEGSTERWGIGTDGAGSNDDFILGYNNSASRRGITIHDADGTTWFAYNVAICNANVTPSAMLEVRRDFTESEPTDTYSLALTNLTAAAAGDQVSSPALRMRGYGWKTDTTAASQSVDMRVFVQPVQGAAAPTGYLSVQAAINGGAYAECLRINSTQLTPSQVLLTDANRGLVTVATLAESLGGTGRSVFTYAASIGNGAATSFSLTHNLNTRDVAVSVYRNSTPWDEVTVDVEHTDANTVTVKFNSVPTTNEYRVAIK